MTKGLSKILMLFLAIFLAIGSFAVFRFSNFSEAQENETNIFSAESEGSVYICPNATSLEEISPRCLGKITLKLGETINGLTLGMTNYEGKDYYLVFGFVNGGGEVNLPPKAKGGGPYEGYSGLPITFDASNSSDPNDDPLQYRWDFDNDGTWDTDWLENPKIDHIWNDDYEGVVKLEVSDGEFSDIDTAQVKVISPKTLKKETINKLESAKIGDKKTDKNIDKIIWLISQSLDENLWIDASRLIFFEKSFGNFNEKEFEEMFDKSEWTGSKSGIVVFHYEKVAIRLMMDEIKFKKNPDELKDIFKKVIERLVKADVLLTKVSIFDAKNTEIKEEKLRKIIEHQIAKAEEELIKAEKELAKDRPDKAIMRLSKAWLHAQLVIKFANLEAKP